MYAWRLPEGSLSYVKNESVRKENVACRATCIRFNPGILTTEREEENMKNNTAEIVFILDNSGSMGGLESDTIGGYNSFLNRQKKEGGTALVSTVLFNNESTVLHDRVSIETVQPMTEKDYTAGGCTALLDALGGAIRHIKMVHRYIRKEDIPDKTIFVITTDGMENASRRFSYRDVKQLVEEQKKAGWEFLFLGANIDAVAAAAQYGISEDRAVRFHSDKKGTALNYEVISETVSSMRAGDLPIGRSWKKRITEDYESRSKE